MTQQSNWPYDAWGNAGAQGENEQEGAAFPSSQNAYQQAYYDQGTAPSAEPAYASQPQAGYGNAYAYGAPQPVYAAAPVAAEPKKGKGWIVALVAVVLFFLLMFFGITSCNAAFSAMADPFGMLGEDLSTDVVTTNSVGIIDIDGTIQYDGTTSSPEGLKAQLDRAEQNPYIKAVVLRVNSGGGTATAGEEMATYVRDFSKPIVVSSASMNASAAYEISSQADYIFTAKTTAIGAIGTAMQITDMSGLLEKLGITIENVTSADSKDSSYGTRPLTEEELAYYQKMVDDINETFIETVAAGRSMSIEDVRALATGLTFTGMDAIENGLADEIGTLEDAVAMACELAGCDSCDTVYLRPGSSDLSSLLDLMGSSNASSDLSAIVKELGNDVGFKG